MAANDDAKLDDIVSEELAAFSARYLGVVYKGSIRTFQISTNNIIDLIDIGVLDLEKYNRCHRNDKKENQGVEQKILNLI